MFQITSFPVGSYRANCYILTNTAGTFVIDPGAEPDLVLALTQHLNVKGIILTHCHSDHIGAVNELKEKTGAPIYIGEADVPGAANPRISGFEDEGSDYRVTAIDVPVHDGYRIVLGDDSLTVIETPGHTIGSICLWDQKANKMFTGDTLFSFGYGRTDYETGNMTHMRESLRKLAQFDQLMHVLPGHGPATLLGAEFARNPFLIRADSENLQ
ncbi:MBL fold metallo-hydrolase [Arcanobacterium ihumii]|uniref:MBL fold metallo-hydrolase n=1 Tax=Arcanobacterium ihumii TaxID=2138162 RepID=UPI000F5460F5|nr:MBL fold metallo-hydrolase [Arcanobacterium ihumii]